MPDASLFRSGRQFAAWLGLTLRSHSSGGKERLGVISKQGNGYLRKLLVVGATAVMPGAFAGQRANDAIKGPHQLVSGAAF